MAQVKQKLKQIPFNLSVPWNESIAQYIGTSVPELTANLPTDPTLHTIVGSTCTMIRDMAIKELVSKNSKAAITLSDMCYGHGYVMHEGNMVSTGACKMSAKNAKGEAVGVGDGANAIVNTCALKEGDIFVKLRKFFGVPGMTPAKPMDRLKNYNKLGEANTSGLGAPDYIPETPAAFLQQSSNESLPNYVNSTLAGKGFTYNASPMERYDSKINKAIFHAQGYATAAEGTPAPVEEAETLGIDTRKAPILKSDQTKELTKMVVPDFVCTLICAGLNLDDLMGDIKVTEPPQEPPVSKGPQLNNPEMNNDEGMHMNTYRYGVDQRVMPNSSAPLSESLPNAGQNLAGKYECEMASPEPMVCMEKGAEVVHWIMERVLNKDSFCDYETGNCATLFAA